MTEVEGPGFVHPIGFSHFSLALIVSYFIITWRAVLVRVSLIQNDRSCVSKMTGDCRLAANRCHGAIGPEGEGVPLTILPCIEASQAWGRELLDTSSYFCAPGELHGDWRRTRGICVMRSGVCVLARRGLGAITGLPTPCPGRWPWFLEKLAFEQAGQERVPGGDPAPELHL